MRRARPSAAPWAFLVCVLPALAEGALVRANCRGIQELSSTAPAASCAESNTLAADDHVMLGHTRAAASLPGGRLMASAGGGQVRDAGANGGEAGALLKDTLALRGEWDGYLSVEVRLCVAYRFAGFGESRLHATLRTSPAGAATGVNRARVRLRHRGFGGTVLEDFESRGRFATPRPGPRPPDAAFVLGVTERVSRDAPTMSVRADIAVFALPNLEPLEPVLWSFVRATAWIAIRAPEHVELVPESGTFLSEPEHGARQGADGAWVIMAAATNGDAHALRSDRGGHRAAARSDCGHQFFVDG